MTPDRAAILEADVCAFEWVPPNAATITPLLSFRVGYFAVCRAAEGSLRVGPRGITVRTLPWMVMHLASGCQCMDFNTSAMAWRFADEISVACGDRIEHEPKTPAEFCAAVPDVVQWVQQLAAGGWQELPDGGKERVFWPPRTPRNFARAMEALADEARL